MSSTTLGIISLAFVFGGALFGIWLRTRLPGQHLREDSKDTIKLGAGMIATLAALVLGLLVGSAKSSFDSTNESITHSAAKIIQLDRVLAHYGPETKEIRDRLRGTVASGIELFWPEEPTAMVGLKVFERQSGMETIQVLLEQLTPKNDMQHHLVTQAESLCNDLTLARWLLIESEENVLPLPLLGVLVLWLSMLFVSFGLFAPFNKTVVTVLFLCALSVSAAVFLISEMNQPLSGTIKANGAPMRKALEHLSEG